jgi:DNA replication and repair protein RecF
MERSRSGLQSLRLDGEDARSLGELAKLFPVQVFHPGTVEVVEGGPGGRRRFLDWGLFHVEQSFLPLHRQFRQALSQRNRLLKSGGAPGRELEVWDRQVVSASDRIDGLRRAYLRRLEPEVNRLLAQLPELPEVAVELYSGWPRDADLADLMRSERHRDQVRGFTGRGAHRADLKLTARSGLVLAQLIILTRDSGKRCLVMVDDLGSELDSAHRAGILRMIGELDQQTVFTALEADSELLAPLNRDVRMFHVEHGALRVQ